MGRRGRVWGADRGSRSCCAGEIVREEILPTDTPIFYRLYDVLHAGHWSWGLLDRVALPRRASRKTVDAGLPGASAVARRATPRASGRGCER